MITPRPGIGRAVALAFAREGADGVLSYLEVEEADADETVNLVEAEGRKAIRSSLAITTYVGLGNHRLARERLWLPAVRPAPPMGRPP